MNGVVNTDREIKICPETAAGCSKEKSSHNKTEAAKLNITHERAKQNMAHTDRRLPK